MVGNRYIFQTEISHFSLFSRKSRWLKKNVEKKRNEVKNLSKSKILTWSPSTHAEATFHVRIF